MAANTIFSQSLRHAVTVLVFMLGVSGCTTIPSETFTAQRAKTQEEWRNLSAKLGEAYAKNPNDKKIALGYARTLTALKQYAQANAVLRSIALQFSGDSEILAAYGRSLIDVGRLEEAKETLANAHSPEQPNWQVLSAQGVVEDSLGHPDNAQKYYANALKIASYALTKRLDESEKLLRLAEKQSPANVRIRENLAFVLGLQEKWDEVQTLLQRDHTADEVRQNLAYLVDLTQVAKNQPASVPTPTAVAEAPKAIKPRKFAEVPRSSSESAVVISEGEERIQEVRNDEILSIPPEGSDMIDPSFSEAHDEEIAPRRKTKRRALGSLRGGI